MVESRAMTPGDDSHTNSTLLREVADPTNHRAWVFWMVRRLFTNTDLQTLVSFGDSINDSLPLYSNSVGKSDRIRFQTDLLISF